MHERTRRAQNEKFLCKKDANKGWISQAMNKHKRFAQTCRTKAKTLQEVAFQHNLHNLQKILQGHSIFYQRYFTTSQLLKWELSLEFNLELSKQISQYTVECNWCCNLNWIFIIGIWVPDLYACESVAAETPDDSKPTLNSQWTEDYDLYSSTWKLK